VNWILPPGRSDALKFRSGRKVMRLMEITCISSIKNSLLAGYRWIVGDAATTADIEALLSTPPSSSRPLPPSPPPSPSPSSPFLEVFLCASYAAMTSRVQHHETSPHYGSYQTPSKASPSPPPLPQSLSLSLSLPLPRRSHSPTSLFPSPTVTPSASQSNVPVQEESYNAQYMTSPRSWS